MMSPEIYSVNELEFSNMFWFLYPVLMRPHLNSCPQCRRDMDLTECVQRRTVKIIRGVEQLSYEERAGVVHPGEEKDLGKHY